jgi:hypothetical protein
MAHATTQPILRSVNRLVADLPSDRITPSVEVQVELARNLARQLDAAGPGGSGAIAQALPSIARELQSTLERILRASPDPDPFLDSLFRDDDGIDVRVRVRPLRADSATEDDD